MLSASGTTVPAPATSDPDTPEAAGPALAYRRFAAPVVVLTALALLVVGVANVQVARRRTTVERDLATARVAAARVLDHLTAGDGPAVRADLVLLIRSADHARAGSAGLSWRVADRADLNDAQVRAVRDDSRRASLLAAAAVPLAAVLEPLTAPTTPTLDELDDLARGLSRYATAARRSGDPSAADLNRAAVAAGLLPALAGAEGPRNWTICRAAAGPCSRTTMSADGNGLRFTRPSSVASPERPRTAGADLLLVGLETRTLFPANGAWDVAATFTLLFNLGPGAGTTTRTVHSAVEPEQLAIDGLSHRVW